LCARRRWAWWSIIEEGWIAEGFHTFPGVMSEDVERFLGEVEMQVISDVPDDSENPLVQAVG